MSRTDGSGDGSFLNRLIRELDALPRLRAGKESIVQEARDLFRSSCMRYIRERYGDFAVGSKALRRAGIDYDRAARIRTAEDGTHILTVQFSGGVAEVPHLEDYFTDSSGTYNSKGYYDAETVEKFERTLFQLLDEIIGNR